jgi:LDH2 family malate/lactate/ureidoglycolate dehydrogenase
MPTQDYCCLPAGALLAFTTACLERAGLEAGDSNAAARALVRADQRGISTHGTNRLPGYVRAMQAGRINPRPRLRVIHDAGGALLVDGDGGLGHLVSTRTMERCIDRARDTGTAFAAVRRSSHNGAASLYALMAAEADMIGLSLTGGGVRVAPAGGREALLGTNPIAFAAPTAVQPPFVLDMATSIVSGGKVEEQLLKGEPLSPGWALDPEGRPTTDPDAANRGALLPLGGSLALGSYKGFGLSLVVEILCNVLTGMAAGPERARQSPAAGSFAVRGSGHFFAAIRIEGFQPIAAFKERLDANLAILRAATPATGCDRIYTPGEVEWERELACAAAGVPLHPKNYAALVELAGELALPPPTASHWP